MLEVVDITEETKDTFISLCSGFYHSDAVMHPIPKENIINSATEALSGSPFIRCLLLMWEGEVAGYAVLSFFYSNEAGGLTVWMEELLVLEKFRGKGIAKKFFAWTFETYEGKAKRYRLEVAEENKSVCELYKRMGFENFPYIQMIRGD